MNSRFRTSTLVVAGLLAGCATIPNGPSVLALPGAGVSFDQFRADDYACQGYAMQAIGAPGAQATAQQSAVNSAAVGTAVGAAAGALLGAATGDAAAGAAFGAGSGLIVGSAAGSDAYGASGYAMQQRYDNAYVQCMYAKGHQVPVPASVAAGAAPTYTAPTYPAPAPRYPPPGAAYPPPGTPPPPGY